jgi:hypothetical protein
MGSGVKTIGRTQEEATKASHAGEKSLSRWDLLALRLSAIERRTSNLRGWK